MWLLGRELTTLEYKVYFMNTGSDLDLFRIRDVEIALLKNENVVLLVDEIIRNNLNSSMGMASEELSKLEPHYCWCCYPELRFKGCDYVMTSEKLLR